MESFQVVVIGAGQAGLASAQQLTKRGLVPGRDFLVLDAGKGPGGAWRQRWDSLTLGKAHGIADLPGMPAPPGDDTKPASQEVSDYYGAYEERFALAVRRPARVTGVEQPEPDADFLLSLGAQPIIRAQVIINATGTWDSPFTPYVPGSRDFSGTQLHTRDYVRAADFADRRVLVVGGGLSAVQFLLELEGVARETTWATRRAPDFVNTAFDARWGRGVEDAVRTRVFGGDAPASVVSTTGIPPWPVYLDAVERGLLVSRGMFTKVDAMGVTFGPSPAAPADYPQPRAWQPFAPGTHLAVDVIFWNTGFRPVLDHLAALHLRTPRGGIALRDEVTSRVNPRVFLAGYGSTASTIGATRAGRLAAKGAVTALGNFKQ